MSPGAFEELREDLKSNGVTLPEGDDGEAPGPHGLHFKWHFESVEPGLGSSWLRIQITGTGWIVDKAWGAIEPHVLKFVGR